MYDYDEVIEKGEWVEDQGKRFSRYFFIDNCVWVDHYTLCVISDPSEAE